MSQQPQNDLSINEVEGQNAMLNQPDQQVTVFGRLRNYALLKFSKKNIIKGLFLIIIITATFWMASDFLHQSLIRSRIPFKFGSESQDVYQIAAPDDTGLRSFYYFQKMVEIAKKNIKQGKTFDESQLQNLQFQEITFWEVYGLFKVVKAIELANKYEEDNQDTDKEDEKDQEEEAEEIRYDTIDNLTAFVNLTPAADQVMCSSCYSFPIAATIEYQITKKTGKIIKLSEQQLIDCSNPNRKANGCNDGNMTRAFQYAREQGLVEEKSYPYRSQTGVSYLCNDKIVKNETNEKYKIHSFKSLPSGSCEAIQYQLVTGNAVASMINVGQMNNIKNYSERNNLFYPAFRDCLKTSPNHAITIVGQTQNQDWIVRNSWGQSWGNNGYFIIKKGNTCGICNHAIVPRLQ